MPRTIRYGSTSRPHWSFHPACLFCNWDDGEWPFAAHLGPRPNKKKHPVWYTTREYVAWLCEDCAAHDDRAQWFVDTVNNRYPNATFVQSPGTNKEEILPSDRKRFMAAHRAWKNATRSCEGYP